MARVPGCPPVARVRHARWRGTGPACLALALFAGAACEQPEEPDPPVIETVYLLDRVDGATPPAPVCESDGVSQVLRFESIALADDGTYGRLQETQVGGGSPVQQEERGAYERGDGTITLHPAGQGTLLLTLLDSAGTFARRIHACGDSLRYRSVPVEG